MFEVLTTIRAEKVGKVLVGTVTQQAPYFRHVIRSQVGAMAVRAESVDDFLDYSESIKNKKGHAESSLRIGIEGFNPFETWEEAMDTYRNHPENVCSFLAKDDPLVMPTNGNEVAYDTEGSFIDMGRFLESVPECFGENINGNPNNIFATIVVNLCTSASVREHDMRVRGERVLRLVDWFESQNIRTEVLGLMSNECAHVEIAIKQHEETLDKNTLAVALHPDFYRRMIFRVKEISRTFTSGHGSGMSIANRNMTKPEFDEEGIFIFSEAYSGSATINRVFDQLERDIEEGLSEGAKNLSFVV